MIIRKIITLAFLCIAAGASAKDILNGGAFEFETVQAMRIERW